jgi:hypothetical protein
MDDGRGDADDLAIAHDGRGIDAAGEALAVAVEQHVLRVADIFAHHAPPEVVAGALAIFFGHEIEHAFAHRRGRIGHHEERPLAIDEGDPAMAIGLGHAHGQELGKLAIALLALTKHRLSLEGNEGRDVQLAPGSAIVMVGVPPPRLRRVGVGPFGLAHSRSRHGALAPSALAGAELARAHAKGDRVAHARSHRCRAASRGGRTESVCAYVSAAIDAQADGDTLARLLDAMDAELGPPPTPSAGQ